MTWQAFEVGFTKRLVNSQGQPSDVLLEAITVRGARTEHRAVQAAFKRFERARRLKAWDQLADKYHVRRLEAFSEIATAQD